MSKIVKKKLKIDGMHCSSCAMNIEFDLEDVEGIKSAKASLVKEECEVEFDEEKVNEQMIIQTIQKTGYQARLQEESKQ
ncbi:heavy-metal-associated domain-containing protein [Candidatus Daviesbacteria bacterium]|nr:heavy-metal-associated domain-containing protein [Candidatus Daviesbacteria bacterium]